MSFIQKPEGSFCLVLVDSNALLNVYLSNDDIAKLLVPLLKLRQACCHPQVGSCGLCSLQHNPLSMDEILQVDILLFFSPGCDLFSVVQFFLIMRSVLPMILLHPGSYW